MTPKAKEIVKMVLTHWRRGQLSRLPHAQMLVQLCAELEGEL